MPGISSPFVIPLVSTGIAGGGPSGNAGGENIVHPPSTAPLVVHQNQQNEGSKPGACAGAGAGAEADASIPKSSGL